MLPGIRQRYGRLGTKFKLTAFILGFLNYLHPLARYSKFPVSVGSLVIVLP